MSSNEKDQTPSQQNLAEVFKDIKDAAKQFDGINAIMDKVLKIALEKERNKVKVLEHRVAELEAAYAIIEDESESLWWMLDEIKRSETWTEEQTEELQKSIDQQMLTTRLMQLRKGEA
jgi:hypothetical protein